MIRTEIDGKRLEIQCFGNPQHANPALIFLHEGLGSISQWRDFPEQIWNRTGCPTIVYNRAGYGRSDSADLPRTIDFMHQEANRALPELLKTLQVQSVIFIGHSDGGSIAIIHSASPKIPIRAFVLLAPHVFVEELTIRSIEQGKQEYLNGDLKARLAKHHPFTDHTFLGWTNIWLDPEFRSWNIEEYLPSIQAPVLLIQGEEDPFGTTRQIESIQTKSGGPVEVFLIPRCGHRPHVEKSQETTTRVVAFLHQHIQSNRQ
jgi:pimeloyl-ACP methyl ester carboxylesterase